MRYHIDLSLLINFSNCTDVLDGSFLINTTSDAAMQMLASVWYDLNKKSAPLTYVSTCSLHTFGNETYSDPFPWGLMLTVTLDADLSFMKVFIIHSVISFDRSVAN